MKKYIIFNKYKISQKELLINLLVAFFFIVILLYTSLSKNPKYIKRSLGTYIYNDFQDVVNPNDLTAYKDLKFTNKTSRLAWDKRYGESQYRATFFVFKAKFYDSQDINVLVNSEFETHEKVAEVALNFSKKIGQLPFFLRKKIKWIVIHGPWVDKEKCTCAWYAQRNAGFYIHTEMVHEPYHEETIIHEAAHVSIDGIYYNDHNFPVWENAQNLDNKFISKYAKEHPFREDIAESLVAWVASRCKQNRIDKSIHKEIIEKIPNRLRVLDDLIDKNHTYPLICKY